ncbi:DUF3971 domain-containing protein [Halomonas sp. ZH2S]|uniref:DUF3971 domain-containing protein n=1 Tax=Vreelandella zhuhanensis TaxID=2684210 RepID=A0A7X3KNZ0_9GAMM|nr:AsmA-like C-terminal region-containing protein [Halomonas zhuhanensis]MWJ26865.1 DUF3971 domain-containing protein [Halomonas zhuhanensis]
MMRRSLVRWGLALLAVVLGGLAVLLVVLRLLMSQADALIPHIETLLEARIGASVKIDHLSLQLARNDPLMRLSGVHVTTAEGETLLALEQAKLRLDTFATLGTMAPVFNDARISGLAVHLYQQDEGARWYWPGTTELPLEYELDLETLDAWAALILRQRLWVQETSIVLHGRQRTVTLLAPELLMSGDYRRTRLEGTLEIARQDAPGQVVENWPAVQMQVEVQPGKHGFRDFSAALQLDMQLDNLRTLAQLLLPARSPQLQHASGEARLWGRWQAGALADARIDLDMSHLALRHQTQEAVLRDIHAQGQWLRRGDGGEAWLEGDADTVDWMQPTESGDVGPALPHHWYLIHDPDGWEVRTSEFELSSLAAWREHVPLPEALSRVVATLAPRGQVSGLSLGHRHDQWEATAAISGLEASPWGHVPGGGPLDAWVEARDLRGRVLFNSDGASTLYFPNIFSAPMTLNHAQGEVQWVYDGPDSLISGRNLLVDWEGARVQGGFGLVTGKPRGHFGLDIAFRDVDAVERPLAQWLPMGILGEDLSEWLLSDVGAVVRKGTFSLSQPLFEGVNIEDIELELALDIVDGYLPIAPGWPMLEGIEGHLQLSNQRLQAVIDSAHSHGVKATSAEVLLEDGQLRIDGKVASSVEEARNFLQAAPLEGMQALDDWQGEGRINADIALNTFLEAPEALQLEINAQPQLSRLTYEPLSLNVDQVGGMLSWTQQGQDGGLAGQMAGRLWEGDVSATIDTHEDRLSLQGESEAGALLRWAGVPPERTQALAKGRAAWQGRLELEPSLQLQLNSTLQGLELMFPAPLQKPAQAAWPWSMKVDIENGTIQSELANVVDFRGRLLDEGLAGALWLGEATPLPVDWPTQPGWTVKANVPRLEPLDWLSLVELFKEDMPVENKPANTQRSDWQLAVQTPCLTYQDQCLGSVEAEGRMSPAGIELNLSGSLVAGRVHYRPQAETPLDISVGRLMLDDLMVLSDQFTGRAGSGETVSATATGDEQAQPRAWMSEIETRASAELSGIPPWLEALPDGRLRVAEIVHEEKRVGPLTAYWKTRGNQFTLAPVGLTLGQISARGELRWEGDATKSRTHVDLTLQGGDIGTALARLAQPNVMHSRRTNLATRLTWPGAPWELELSRSEGELSIELHDGRFLNIESTPVELIGLLNFDNLVRRLRLDFSDVIGQGTVFNRVHGSVDIADGELTTREVLEIDTPATTYTMAGTVDLIRRELDQRLGVRLPISQSMPLAALIAGGPLAGGAFFIAHQLFGDAINRATTIYYRVRGPWAAPQITLEGTQ